MTTTPEPQRCARLKLLANGGRSARSPCGSLAGEDGLCPRHRHLEQISRQATARLRADIDAQLAQKRQEQQP
jgi:hypothetical protein